MDGAEHWIKICGLTDAQAVSAALEAGADAIGFVLASSVRQVDARSAAALAAPARGRARIVAVTLHPTQALIDEMLEQLRPDVLQTDVEDFAQLTLPSTLARLPVLRAAVHTPPARFLFEGARSGSGQPSDWQQAARLARRGELILAGGLNADNVRSAIASVRPFGVDVSSGVEHEPGRKSPQRIAQFITAARSAFAGALHERS